MKISEINAYELGVIKTFTGKFINVFDPKPEHINIVDIAHALSHTCRFSGHTTVFYSVAAHSIWCEEFVQDEPVEIRLHALLHDASEAYLTDMPSPIKQKLPQYIELEKSLMKAIYRKFGLDDDMPPAVKAADHAALEYEEKFLLNNHMTPPYISSSALQKMIFIDRYNDLKNLRKK